MTAEDACEAGTRDKDVHVAGSELEGAPEFDIGGLQMTYGPNDNEGLDKIFMTVIQGDGSFKAVDTLTKVSAN